MSLIEKMLVCAIIIIIASISLPTVSKSYKNARAWIWGSYSLHENRLNAVLDDRDELAEKFLTSKVHKWSEIKISE